MDTRRRVILDTDIGNDIDDAVALAYLLRQPACELLGVTTVTGDTVQRAALADVVCRAAGRDDVPIYAGLAGPLLFGRGQPEVPQYAAIADAPHRTDYPSGAALAFLRDTIRANPGQVTLLAIGPLTNIGALFAADPELPGLLRELVLMCGVFYGAESAREWNALVDPIATALTYKYAPAGMLSVGLDVTMQCTLDAALCRERFAAAGGPLARTLALAEVWFQHTPRITFHDPLAAALLFEPGLCDVEAGQVDVDLQPGESEGRTLWTPAADGRHRVARTVSAERFFAHYFNVTGG